MKFKREPGTWRSSAEIDTESEANDYEPLLSDASVASRRSFGATCMFPDASETSDFESSRHIPPRVIGSPSTAPQRQGNPYFLPSISNNPKVESSLDDKLSRFKYYSKIKNFIRRDDTSPCISSHIVPSSVFVPYIPGSDKQPGKQSSIVTIFAVWNTIMGTSLLTMPWGIEKAGLANGIFLMMIMGALCLYTAYMLLRAQQLHGGGHVDWEVSELAGFLLGRQSEMIAKLFSFVVLLGANIVYWILMSNFLYHSVDYLYERIYGYTELSTNYSNSVMCPKNVTRFTSPAIPPDIVLKKAIADDSSISFYNQMWNLEATVPIFLVLIIGPLVNFRSATFFTKFNSLDHSVEVTGSEQMHQRVIVWSNSTKELDQIRVKNHDPGYFCFLGLGTLSVLYLLSFVIVKSSIWGVNADFFNTSSPLHVSNFNPSFPALTGMLALALFIHNIIVTIMRNNKHHEKNGRDLSIAFVLVILTYLIVGVAFYIAFPLDKRCIEANLLDNFENSDAMTVVARVFLFFQLVTVFPLITYMLRVQLFTTLMKTVYPGFQHVLLLNTVIISICVLFAIFFPRIGTIIRFTGALSGFVYIFTLPSLLHLASLRKRGKMTASSAFFHVAIIVFGFANFLAQFFVTER